MRVERSHRRLPGFNRCEEHSHYSLRSCLMIKKPNDEDSPVTRLLRFDQETLWRGQSIYRHIRVGHVMLEENAGLDSRYPSYMKTRDTEGLV